MNSRSWTVDHELIILNWSSWTKIQTLIVSLTISNPSPSHLFYQSPVESVSGDITITRYDQIKIESIKPIEYSSIKSFYPMHNQIQ